MAGPDPLSYCAREVRRHDRARYLSSLFAPEDRREDLFALYAFNLEVAKTAEVVSEAMLGQIRLQWWRESLDEIYAGSPRRHEVVQPLYEAVSRHGLTRARFDALIDAREADLADEPPGDLAQLEAYAEATSASLVILALEILDGWNAETLEAGRAVGLAWALTGLLRALPFHARQKRVYLPADLIAAHGLRLGDLFELRPSSALRKITKSVAERAGRHLEAARALRPKVPRKAQAALLLASLASRHLRLLRRAEHDPFDPRLAVDSPADVWRLAFCRFRGIY